MAVLERAGNFDDRKLDVINVIGGVIVAVMPSWRQSSLDRRAQLAGAYALASDCPIILDVVSNSL